MSNPIAMLADVAGKQQADEKSGPRPRVPYWHLWTDEQGVSHQLHAN